MWTPAKSQALSTTKGNFKYGDSCFFCDRGLIG